MEMDRLLPPAGSGTEITLRRPGPVAQPITQMGQDASTDLQRYLQAARRHKWIVLGIAILGTALGVLATRSLGRQYAAKAILWVEGDARDRDRDIISADHAFAATGWVELATSSTVLDSVVRGLRLYLSPASRTDSAALADLQLQGRVRPGEYRLTTDRRRENLELRSEDGTVVQRAAAGDSIGGVIGLAWVPSVKALTPDKPVEFSVSAPYDAAQQLAKRLTVRMEPGGSFLRVQLKGENPFLIASTVNAVAERVVLVAADLKRQKFEELASILGEQYEHAERDLDAAENALKDFRVRTANLQRSGTVRGFAGGGLLAGDPGTAPPFELRLTLEDLRRDRLAIERAMRSPSGGARTEALAVIRAVQESPELTAALHEVTERQATLRALRYRHTEASATVSQERAALETLEQQTVPTLAGALVADMTAREAAMTPRVDSAFTELRRLPPLALQEARLERDVASAQELFTNVRQRFEGTKLALVSSLPDVRILDGAVEPQKAMGSFGPLLIALSVIASLGLGVVGVTVFDRVDPKVRYPEQVTRGMRLPILGAVPHFRRWSTPGRDEDSQVIESLRALRLRVLHAHGGAGPVVLTITSPSMGDGKSFISLNLALAFADAGYRTLLIDGDVRRGTQHRDLAVAQVPGLTDVLAGQATIEAAVHETAHTGLSFIGAGTRLPRAPELLLSPNLRNIIQRLRIASDVIIIDSPPLGAGADPLVLGTASGNLLLVLRSGTTDMPLALSQLDVLDTLPVRTIGAVLNDVRGRDAFRYYTYEAAPGESPPAGAVAAARWARRPTIIGGRT